MIGSIVKKLFFKKSKKDEAKEEEKKGLALALRERSQMLSDGVISQIESMKTEFIVMREKYNNLQETNYNLGLKHLENGNLKDAIFRFRFIRKFWPNDYDAIYQLGYCLALYNKPEEAKAALEDLIKKDPQHQQGKELLNLINSSANQNPAAQDSKRQ